MTSAGDYKHNVEVLLPVPTSIGDRGQSVYGYQSIVKCPAHIESLTGSKLLIARQIIPSVTHEIKIRYADNVSPECVITFGSRTFQIGNVNNTLGNNYDLTLLCIEQVNYVASFAPIIQPVQCLVNLFLISVVWSSPEPEVDNSIMINASCTDFQGMPFLSNVVEATIVCSDASNDYEPSHSATLSSPQSIAGEDTATLSIQSDTGGAFTIVVSEATSNVKRYLWLRGAGNETIWLRSSTGLQELDFN